MKEEMVAKSVATIGKLKQEINVLKGKARKVRAGNVVLGVGTMGKTKEVTAFDMSIRTKDLTTDHVLRAEPDDELRYRRTRETLQAREIEEIKYTERQRMHGDP